MEKTFSKIEISVIKSAAKNAAPYVAKKQKLEAQIKEVEEKVAEQIRKRAEEKIEKIKLEMAGYQSIIDSLNASVKQITGGYTTEDLVDIKKEATGSVNPQTGKEIFKTVYVLKYPETVIPVDCYPATPAEATPAPEEEQIPEEAMQPTPEDVAAAEAAEANPFGDADPFANPEEGFQQ